MLKKFVTYTGLALLVFLFGAYFFFASILKEQGKEKEVCTTIKVTILDSMINRFVSEKEVRSILINSPLKPIGTKTDEISLTDLEELLNAKSAIKRSDVAISRDGVLRVSVTQRRPLLRIESESGGFYVDESCYIFPLVNTFTSYVPIVTGAIPIKLKPGQRGVVGKEEKKWLSDIMNFGNYLYRNEFWNAQIQQIHIMSNGDIALYTRVGDQKIIFGPVEDIGYKFGKLYAFYQNIVPVYGWDRYSEINLKYSNQIVCKTRK